MKKLKDPMESVYYFAKKDQSSTNKHAYVPVQQEIYKPMKKILR